MTDAGPVAYFALGGTIAMAAAPEGGVVSGIPGQELLDGLGPLPFDVRVQDPSTVPSASLTFGDVLGVVDLARAAVDDGAVGVVLTQGTDTLEETAFLIDSVWDRDAAFVVSGAMRNPTMAGPDGPGNLLSSLQVAAAGVVGGTVVVFADEIHAARHVRKTHTSSTATFVSADLGPIGHVVEGHARVLASVPPRRPVTGVDRDRLAGTRVALHVSVLDDGPDSLIAVAESAQGLVVAGFGAGHVPAELVPALASIADRMPVVLTSRAGGGPVLADTYGAPGAERDLLARGLIGGGYVHPYKARVLLRLLLAAGADGAAIAAAFTDLG
jgi:L-asparaginase/Glu-tRNA(Gln) amidotransferase subunit D